MSLRLTLVQKTMDQTRRGGREVVRKRLIWLLPFLFALIVAATGCNSGSCCDPTFEKISAPDRDFSISNFEQDRFKTAKEYDVSDLPDAVAAYMGFYTWDGPAQYELRMYPDHATALASGVSYAEEVTGEDAKLRSADVRWEEGTKDRRGGGAFSGSLTPLYGDYAVVGNVIVLCEGRDSAQALERCARLLWAIGIGVEG